MAINVIRVKPSTGGFQVTVRVPNAFSDGTAREDDYFVANETLRGKTPEQMRRAVREVVLGYPTIKEALGVGSGGIPDPTDTRADIEEQAAANMQVWRDMDWRIAHIADYPGLTTPQRNALLTALTNRRDAAIARDLALMVRWRTAEDDTGS